MFTIVPCLFFQVDCVLVKKLDLNNKRNHQIITNMKDKCICKLWTRNDLIWRRFWCWYTVHFYDTVIKVLTFLNMDGSTFLQVAILRLYSTSLSSSATQIILIIFPKIWSEFALKMLKQEIQISKDNKTKLGFTSVLSVLVWVSHFKDKIPRTRNKI